MVPAGDHGGRQRSRLDVWKPATHRVHMRTRLSLEIFGVFLLSSLVLVVLTVTALRFFFSAGFRDYIYTREDQRLPYLGRVLEDEYRKGEGWKNLGPDSVAWREVLSTARERESADEDAAGTGGKDARKRSKGWRGLPSWLFLLDQEGRIVTGERDDGDSVRLVELRVEGRTVGWVGLNRDAPIRWPLETAFVEQQYRVFTWLGGGAFLLAVLISVILSRRFLVPIRRLMDGTQALASRRFDVRIEVPSRNELGRLADDFNRTARTLETYEAMRREWLSDISHELRTPLSILQGEIQALQDGVRPLGPEAIDSLQAEVDRLARLVEALHFLSLAESEGLAMRRDRMEPVRILQERAEAFRDLLNRAGIALDLDEGGLESVVVLGDADQLGRVFSNLLQNSLQHTDSPGTLRIRAVRQAGHLEITFEDSAPGVPDEALDRIFDRLFRVDKSRSRALGGSGLGLSIARKIVEAHGGGMTAAHAEAGGLKMTVALPLLNRNG